MSGRPVADHAAPPAAPRAAPAAAPTAAEHLPDWLDEPGVPGRVEELGIRVLGHDLAIGIWSPGDGELPMLVAHDGPEYAKLAGLTRFAGAMIERGALPPFRVALLPPGARDEWYSASAAYGRALCFRILPALADEVAVAGRPVGMAASLGAVAMLEAQRRWPGSLGGMFLQSGSFFFSRFDNHESSFARYGRVVRFVRGVLRARSHPDPVDVEMTCGESEENVHNNRLMAAALASQGYGARLHELPKQHNYEGWRDALHPHLTRMLAALWSPP